MASDVRHFLLKLAVISAICAVLYAPVLVFNVGIDPYGVFREASFRRAVVPNERIVKMRYILNHPEREDSFVFGSSLVNNIDITKLPDGRWYDFWTNSATLAEHADDIRFLLERDVPIKQLLIGVEAATYQHTEDHSHALPTITFPKHGSAWKTKVTYLFTIPDYGVVKETFFPRELIRYDYEDTGRAFFTERERGLREHPEAHAASVRRTLGPDTVPQETRATQVAQALDAAAEITRLAKEHNIRLTFFVNPMRPELFRAQHTEAYFSFIRGLAELAPTVDFSEISCTTENPTNFYEYVHYRPVVGDLMLPALGNASGTPAFGTRLTPSNIDAHLESLRAQLARPDPKCDMGLPE